MRSIKRTLAALAVVCALCTGSASAAPYMVVDLATGGVTYEDGGPSDYTNDVYKTTKMVFRKVPAGTYAVQGGMTASMEKDYYIGVYEVTVGQYALMQNPNAAVAATAANMKPKAGVSYSALRGYNQGAYVPKATSPLGKLGKKVRAATGDRSISFDLPTEAMWEVAARAMPSGDDSHAAWEWFFGATDSDLGDHAWFEGNGGGAIHAVGLKQPNAWGLYDMYGNVWEWCRDHYQGEMSGDQAGNTTASGYNRVIRGGGFGDDSTCCRSGVRYCEYYNNTVTDRGFRIATCEPSGETQTDLGAAAGSVGSYMVVDLATGGVAYERGTPADYTNAVYKTTKMVFRKVPAGKYAVQGGMTASMEKDYYVGVYEVTVGQYALMTNRNASVAATAANMVPNPYSWYDVIRGTGDGSQDPTATSPIGKLTAAVRSATGDGAYLFDLPSEAMWEVAARAMPARDTSHATWEWFFDESGADIARYAWYLPVAGGEAREVGTVTPNDWGFFDMYGNAFEWCRDHYSAQMACTQEGDTLSSDERRVLRGGGYDAAKALCTSSYRGSGEYNFASHSDGFRLSWIVPDSAPLGQVEIDADGDGVTDVVVTVTGEGEGAGSIADNGDGSYDVTGEATIELVGEDGETVATIEVPAGETVTVGGDGTTTVEDGESVTVAVDNGDGTTTTTTVNGPAVVNPDGTVDIGDGGSASSVTTDEGGEIVKVELDIDGDGEPEVVVTPTGEGAGSIADNGDGTYDVTGGATIELVGEDGETFGTIEVPAGETVTVGGDGTTTVDSGESVTVTVGNGDGTTTATTVNGPAVVNPDGTVHGGGGSGIGEGGGTTVEEAATLTKLVTITAWHPIADSGAWRLVFETPEDSVVGDPSNLRPDKSFSLKYATQLGLLASGATPGDGESVGYLSFAIDATSVSDETLTVTVTVLDVGQVSLRNVFLRVTDPRND